jgi:hypothetical protein
VSEEFRPIHRDAGEGVLQGSARHRKSVLEPEISQRVLRRIRHQNQMRLAARRQRRVRERIVGEHVAVQYQKSRGSEARQGAE